MIDGIDEKHCAANAYQKYRAILEGINRLTMASQDLEAKNCAEGEKEWLEKAAEEIDSIRLDIIATIIEMIESLSEE